MKPLNYRLYQKAWVWSGVPYSEKKVSARDAKQLLSSGGLLLRNTFDFDCKEETEFWYVVKDRFGGMEELSANTRNQLRRGQKEYEVRRIDKTELQDKGYAIYTAAAEQYKVKDNTVSKEDFLKRVSTDNTDIEYWGVYRTVDDELVAFSINNVQGDWCSYSTIKAIPTDRKRYCMYALIYEMNRHYLEEREMRYVCDGARSITEHSNIQPFLIDKLKFRKAYCRLRIYYKWWMGIAVKCLYPLRRMIPHRQVRALLMMHGMQIKK